MTSALLGPLSKSRRERLIYIDFRLCFLGRVTRADLCERFGIAPAVATRDFSNYKHLAPANLVMDPHRRQYGPADTFVPVFDHVMERVLTELSSGFGDGGRGELTSLIACETPGHISRPDFKVLCCVSRAINLGQVLDIEYHSNTSGLGRREIVPIALVDNGLCWHIRAFDRVHDEFRDFVLTRIATPHVSSSLPLAHESILADDQWMRMVDLELVPHPRCRQPAVVEKDFSMIDGVLHLRVRAANAGYILRRWSVDCTSRHDLSPLEHPLCLRNPISLYCVDSAVLAPGFTSAELFCHG